MKTENGALAPEADNAARLVKALMERYAIKAEDIPAASQRSAFRMTWIYWQSCFISSACNCAVSAIAATLRLATTQSYTSISGPLNGGSSSDQAAAGRLAFATGVSNRCVPTSTSTQ